MNEKPFGYKEEFYKVTIRDCVVCGNDTEHRVVWDEKGISTIFYCTVCGERHKYGAIYLGRGHSKLPIKSIRCGEDYNET